MFKSTLLAAALALPLAGPALADTYMIDTAGAHASINFKASHLGFSMLTGRFDTFTGSFDFDPAKPEAGSVTVEIDIASINSNHAERDNHLRSADFFDASNHPKATFVSTGIKATGDSTAVITGDLTMLGTTKSIDIETTYVGGGDDPWGGHRQGFSGTATIVPADFGMPGGIAKAPVELSLEVEGIRQ
ncbi:MAG: YceI family protein [Silicimonas sp.]|nr:YceI family protein [Silicimonas sp.]